MIDLASRIRTVGRRQPIRRPARAARTGLWALWGTRGQSMVEFAVILPVMLTVVGAAIDMSRLYQAWNVLEASTRDAAEYAATKDASSPAATADAAKVVCTETAGLPGYTATASAPGCSSPAVTTTWNSDATAPGANSTYPLVTVTVTTSLPFRTLFPYPLFTQGGAWTLRSSQTYSILQGR